MTDLTPEGIELKSFDVVIRHPAGGGAVALMQEAEDNEGSYYEREAVDRIITRLNTDLTSLCATPSPTDNTALVEALDEAKNWHEIQDKALSKQPPSNADKWMRLQHQEQIKAIDAALSSRAAATTPEPVAATYCLNCNADLTVVRFVACCAKPTPNVPYPAADLTTPPQDVGAAVKLDLATLEACWATAHGGSESNPASRIRAALAKHKGGA